MLILDGSFWTVDYFRLYSFSFLFRVEREISSVFAVWVRLLFSVLRAPSIRSRSAWARVLIPPGSTVAGYGRLCRIALLLDQPRGSQHRILLEKHGALQNVAQLAHVAGPVVGLISLSISSSGSSTERPFRICGEGDSRRAERTSSQCSRSGGMWMRTTLSR